MSHFNAQSMFYYVPSKGSTLSILTDDKEYVEYPHRYPAMGHVWQLKVHGGPPCAVRSSA